ncbi:MAG: YlmC/YmxH family sporulation protein [Eubacteriales bacterium]|nr:YlmC/YmxH family sporulation protein [Eubacteriales bacterium]
MKLCELKEKQVINEDDCKIIGNVADLEFDPQSGCIIYLIVPGPGRICSIFGREFEYRIPFKCIKCIGPDVILVNVCLDKHKEKC